MTGPLVSVILPVYNGERFLAAAIASILAQDYQPIEVIVVDDGSTDGTAAIARSFQGVRYLYQPNQGPAFARNAGIAVARGAFIAFLDADDLMVPTRLSVQAGYLLAHPEI
ncbi:MAG: glycosyltransferase family 2 protein, partial [candidate division NC10 bacterium]|nr:glycosyltransferase family 2 protein [candidate division NC10 bacterium]